MSEETERLGYSGFQPGADGAAVALVVMTSAQGARALDRHAAVPRGRFRAAQPSPVPSRQPIASADPPPQYAPSEIGAVVAGGDSQEAAIARCIEIAEQVTGYDVKFEAPALEQAAERAAVCTPGSKRHRHAVDNGADAA